MRIIAIDRFRGVAIVLMIFFTLILILWPNVPDFLKHNIPNTLHFGDFILPMFLFATGMSLPSFQTVALQRVALQGGVWVILSPFSAGQFLGLDELFLNLVLSTLTVVSRYGLDCHADARNDENSVITRTPAFSGRTWLSSNIRNDVLLASLPILIYLLLYGTHYLPTFQGYLGGYAVIPFYWPVMLAGVIARNHLTRIPTLILISAALSAILRCIIPPHKLIASPSFMMLSVLFSLTTFYILTFFPCKKIEAIGRTPLQYWIIMWVFIIVWLFVYPYF